VNRPGVDFTVFQSADAIVGLIGWGLAGSFGDALGYGVCCGACALLGVVALTTMPRLARRSERTARA
jgi:MFS transporter (putative signal transducer)